MTQSEFLGIERTRVEETGSPINNQIREAAKGIANEVGELLNYTWGSVSLIGKPADRIVEYAETKMHVVLLSKLEKDRLQEK